MGVGDKVGFLPDEEIPGHVHDSSEVTEESLKARWSVCVGWGLMERWQGRGKEVGRRKSKYWEIRCSTSSVCLVS